MTNYPIPGFLMLALAIAGAVAVVIRAIQRYTNIRDEAYRDAEARWMQADTPALDAGEATAKLITPPDTHWIDLKPTPTRWYPMPECELDSEFVRHLDRMFVFRDTPPGNVRTIRSSHRPDDGGTDGAA